MTPQQGLPLAGWTTLELGGPARYAVDATSDKAVREALTWAEQRELPVLVLGGGSNLVVADAGFEGLAIRCGQRGVRVERRGDRVRLEVAAGEPWDEVVALSVTEGWAGLECLSGIPGRSGATPIQNVGAYGQEVAECLREVRVFDRQRGTERCLAREDCGLGYRSSRFRSEPHRFVILSVTFELRAGAAPAIRYAELERALAAARSPSLAAVRETVLGLRRGKSMVLSAADPNRRSVGSFFVNPVVTAETAEAIAAAIRREQPGAPAMPRFPRPDGSVKLAAGWLVERCGFVKGERRGAVGLSSRHALSLVHHGGGSTADLLAFATEIRAAVHRRFGIELEAEPSFVGCAPPAAD